MVTNNIILILASLGLIQGVFLSVYLFTLKQGNRISNSFLAIILIGLTVRIGKSVFGYYMPLEAWQRNIGTSGILAVGPFLWFYGISLIDKDRLFPNWNYLHLLPFTVFLLLFTVIPSAGEFETYWNYGVVVFHLAIYLVISWNYLLKSHLKISNSIFSWYRNILIGVTLVWAYYLGNFLSFEIHYITGPIFYTFLVYAFTYLFLNRHDFILDKYGSSNLDRTTSNMLFQKIRKIFSEEHFFLEEDLSLDTVAKKLTVSPREISQVINENGQHNFHEFVNHYRIEMAKKLLVDTKYMNKKIATIAYDSGFGTVTSFNVVFKKKTKLSPSAYRKQHLKEQVSY